MADLTGQRIILQSEELKSGVPASEGTMQRIGMQGNFLIEQPLHFMTWTLNGSYSIAGSTQYTVDGPRLLTKNYQIHSFACWNYGAGSAGEIIFDIIKRPISGPTQTIFSTNPRIGYNAGSYSRIAQNFVSNTTLFQSPNCVLAVLNNAVSLVPGDFLELNLLGIQTSGFDAGIQLDLRPI